MPCIALMDRLRSKSHMYHIIRTIRVVSHGPVCLFMQQLARAWILIGPFHVGHAGRFDASTTNTISHH